MPEFDQLLRIVHFFGLGLGLSASVMGTALHGLLRGADPAEARGLVRFGPVIATVGGSGLLLLWATGLMLTFTKWGGFANLPWQFHAKITFVVVLTLAVGASHAFQAKARRGDAAAAAMLPRLGLVSAACSVLIVVLAVLSFT